MKKKPNFINALFRSRFLARLFGIAVLRLSKRIYKQKVNDNYMRISMKKAKSDINIAKKIISESYSWSFVIAYNAALQAARAYIFSNGYRTSSQEGHKNAFLFLRASMDEEHQILVTFLERMRVKRNKSIYDVVDLITEKEAKKMLRKTEEFINLIALILGKK